MKKLLITGINGFIGNAAREFFKNDYDVFGIDVAGYPDEKTYIGDMRSELMTDTILRINPDVILHAAGGANVSKSVKNPREDFDDSVAIFYSLLESLRLVNSQCIILFLSSAAVYGNVNTLPISETEPLKPISPYGLHKEICEKVAEYYRRIYDMDIRILRIFSVYGPGLRKQIMWDMFQKYVQNKKIELFGTGDESRDFIYIEDLLHCIDLIIHSENSRDQNIFNIANGESITIKELAHIFSEILCGEDRVEFNKKERTGDPDKWKADISSIKKLGYHQNVPLEQGIMKYIEWAGKASV